MTKTVTISAARANGDPYAHHDVIVTLIAGSAGGVVGSTVVVESSTVRLDANGAGSIPLATNDTGVESPTGSFYRFTVAGSSPTITRSIELTDALPSSVSWTLAGIQVADPTDPQRDVSSDYVTVPVDTLPGVEAAFPPATQSLTNLLASIDEGLTAVAGYAGSIAGDLATTQGEVSTLQTDVSTAQSAADAAQAAADAAQAAADAAQATADGAATEADNAEALDRIASESDGRLNTAVQFSLGIPGGSGNFADGGYTTTAPASFTTGLWVRATVTPLVLTGYGTPSDGDSVFTGMFVAGDPHDWLQRFAVQHRWDASASAYRLYAYGEFTKDGDTSPTMNSASTREIPYGMPTELAVWLQLDNGDGVWEVQVLRRTHFGTPDLTADGAEWVILERSVGSELGTLGATTPWCIGHGHGDIHMPDVQIRDGGPTGTLLANPTAALAAAAGEGVAFTDAQGNVWTPGPDAMLDVPSSGGGVSLGETSTTAYRGDRGKTAYDYSQAHTGATDPHGDRAYAAALVDDLSGVTNASTARTNLGLGSLATLSAIASADITDGTIVAADLAASLLGRIPTTVTVASDVPSPTDGTFTNTTGLAVPVVNGSTYYMVGMRGGTGVHAGALRVSLTCPTGEVRLSVQGKAYASTATVSDTAYSGEILASGDIVTNLAVITGRSTLVPFQGRFTATADGTLQIQHSQRTANATATTVKAGSYLTYHT